MTILGVDVSHFQLNPNFAQVKASGRPFVVLKATEGVAAARRAAKLGLPKRKTTRPVVELDGVRHVLKPRYVDPTLAARRTAAHAAGLIVGLYHFARAGDPAAEARYFLSLIGTLQPGEFLVLDWEVSGANPPAWCKTWLDAVYAATGVRPFIYMNSSAMTGSNWSTVVAGNYGLWLAKYDNSTAPPAVKWWPAAAMKQYSSSGTVPGIAGAVDVDVFYGTAAQLLAYGKGGSTPIQEDDDMKLIQSPARGVAAVAPGYFKVLTAEEAAVAVALYGAALQLNDRQFDVARAVCVNGDVFANGLTTLADIRNKVVDSRFPYSIRTGGKGSDVDDMLGQILSTRAEVHDLAGKVAADQAPAVDPQALADALVANPDAVGKLADALAAALAQRLQS